MIGRSSPQSPLQLQLVAVRIDTHPAALREASEKDGVHQRFLDALLDQAGALIELTQGGKHPLQLQGGETRTWLEDGDSVVLRGWCERPGAARIGFGECEGTVLPARAQTANS